MSCADYLRALLRPLGVYDLNAPFNGASLDVKGAVLDEVQDRLEELGAETDLTTAEDWGLEGWKSLFDLLPAAQDVEGLRAAILALLRIGSGSFTPAAIQDTLTGCGLRVNVEETGAGTVRLTFPDVAGEPEDFETVRRNIEEILPAHVAVEYGFNYLTWAMLESYNWTFRVVESLTWQRLETAI